MATRRGALAAALVAAAALAVCMLVLLGAQQRRLPGAAVLSDEDDLSEAELAGRLAHAIDAHEKCRRHWPHLEKLEAAQEIRVHDARNNLEVSNRAMERARKELRDAEGLVLAARQEHQAYEAQRVAFQQFKSDYDQRTLAMRTDSPARTQDLAQVDPPAASTQQSTTALAAQAAHLEREQQRILAREHDQMSALDARSSAGHPVHRQALAEIPAAPTPILTSVTSSGIVVPGHSEAAAGPQQRRQAHASRADEAILLHNREVALKADEVKAFAELPSEERLARQITRNRAHLRRKQAVDRSRVSVARRQEHHLSRTQAESSVAGMARRVQLAKARHALAKVDLRITQHTMAVDNSELATLKAEERKGPMDARKLNAVQAELRQLRRRHAGSALAGGEARLIQLAQLQDLPRVGRGARGRVLHRGLKDSPVRTESRATLRQQVLDSRRKLRSIRNQLLAVQSRLASQQQVDPAGVPPTQLMERGGARHHDLTGTHQLARDKHSQPTMALYNVYEEKLTSLREERKKADGLLAKAERMLNIARVDSLHAAKTKKAALEELKYATAKLRRYQGLRSKSQHCQMDAWSEIRALTHRARKNQILEGKDPEPRELKAAGGVGGDGLGAPEGPMQSLAAASVGWNI